SAINTRPPYDNKAPRNLLEGQFSDPFCVACTLLGLFPSERLFDDGGITDLRLAALTRRVELQVDPEAEAHAPANGGDRQIGEVSLALGDCTLVERVTIPKGDPRNPMTREELNIKFRRAVSANGGDMGPLNTALDALWRLRDCADAAPRFRIFRGGRGFGMAEVPAAAQASKRTLMVSATGQRGKVAAAPASPTEKGEAP
ncbi:MAG: hypothetical protein PHS60_12925, partial [Zavarzinia sp.]|nr:hypothetical protein [Zavarzinia sp.]